MCLCIHIYSTYTCIYMCVYIHIYKQTAFGKVYECNKRNNKSVLLMPLNPQKVQKNGF